MSWEIIDFLFFLAILTQYYIKTYLKISVINSCKVQVSAYWSKCSYLHSYQEMSCTVNSIQTRSFKCKYPVIKYHDLICRTIAVYDHVFFFLKFIYIRYISINFYRHVSSHHVLSHACCLFLYFKLKKKFGYFFFFINSVNFAIWPSDTFLST